MLIAVFQHGVRPAGHWSLWVLGWLLGGVLQLQQSVLWGANAYGCVLGASLVVGVVAWVSAPHWRRVKGDHSVLHLVMLAVFVGMAWGSTGLRACGFASTALDPQWEGRDLLVSGVVSDLPVSTAQGERVRLAVESASWQGQPVRIPPLIDVGWYANAMVPLGDRVEEGFALQRPPARLRAGERWRMLVRLKAPHGGRNPLGFDYELWLWDQGVQATGYVRAGTSDPVPERLGQTWRQPVDLARQVVRERIDAAVQSPMTAGVLAALVVGDQRAIERTQWDVFRATGVAHLVSISGVHITMFAWAARVVLGWLWRRSPRLCLRWPAPMVGLWGGVGLAWAYSAFAGWGVPAQRTCIMLLTVAALRARGARWPWPLVWLLTCAVVVTVDPWAVLQAGFWLSFVAVGVLFASERPASPDIAGLGWRRRAGRVWQGLLCGAREQGVITLALAPLTLLWFGQVSVVGLLANALAIPWVTLVITPLAMAGVVVPGLWALAAGCVSLMLDVLAGLAALPGATWGVAMAPWWLAAGGTVAGLLAVMPLPWAMRALGGVLVIPVVLWQPRAPAAGEFSILAVDVGQGNAVVVHTAHHALLYDAGPRYSQESDAGHRVLVPLLQALDIRLDRVVLSHRDTDHVGGAEAVLRMQPQADVLSSIDPNHPLQAIHVAEPCREGQTWEWDGVHFSVLHPLASDYALRRKPNAMSCVLRVETASQPSQSALLVGDIEKEQEAALLGRGGALHSTVLLVPHHGSKTSSSGEFLDAVQPTWALVQSGYRNRFGHPAPPVLARYLQRHIMVRDSPHCGAMMWESGAPDVVQCTRVERNRYWHHRVP